MQITLLNSRHNVKILTYRLLFYGYFFTKFCGPKNSPFFTTRTSPHTLPQTCGAAPATSWRTCYDHIRTMQSINQISLLQHQYVKPSDSQMTASSRPKER